MNGVNLWVMKDGNTYRIVEELSPPVLMRGIAIITGFVSFIALFEFFILGFLGVLLSVTLFIPKRIRIVDTKHKIFKTGIVFLNHFSGTLEKMPKRMRYISIITIKQTSIMTSPNVVGKDTVTNIYKDYQINIIHEKRKLFQVATRENKEEALEIAEALSKMLKLDIYVVQPNEKYWIRFQK